MLKKAKLDPRRDVQIVEVAFPNMAPAIREGRIDCGVLVIPFLAVEAPKGDLEPLFTGGDAFGASSVIFQVVNSKFLKANPDAVRGFLADYVEGLRWYYDKANREKAIELVADFTKSPKPVLDSYFATTRDYFRDPGACISAEAIQKPIDAMVDQKLIGERVEAAKYLDLSYLPHPLRPLAGMAPKIDIRGVAKSYPTKGGSVLALQAANLAIKTGEFVSIVGPSGCGKSTLLYIIGGFIAPTGTCWWMAERVTGPGIERGVVFQEYALFPWLTVPQQHPLWAGTPQNPQGRADGYHRAPGQGDRSQGL